ncbi:hypothetical protein BDN72DRAFT_906392 [Pluteus cervinus]|uniref:Uncharacterized protein n=1 Tax=Pluteus cervinus TaxID=181527 RepID=A0ACD2ZZD9_9AGAR|nr:hypothetical protein BDN72DRAFT_906392 [Pluteus cervinus]
MSRTEFGTFTHLPDPCHRTSLYPRPRTIFVAGFAKKTSKVSTPLHPLTILLVTPTPGPTASMSNYGPRSLSYLNDAVTIRTFNPKTFPSVSSPDGPPYPSNASTSSPTPTPLSSLSNAAPSGWHQECYSAHQALEETGVQDIRR